MSPPTATTSAATTSVATAARKPHERESIWRRLHRGFQIQRAFFRVGWLGLISYPMAIVTRQFSLFVSMVMYFFLSQLVDETDQVGGDYFTYVMLGILILRLLDGGLTGFGFQVQDEIQTGRLEGYLVEPVPWSVLPFGMMQFPIVFRAANVSLAFVVALVLGLDVKVGALIPAIALVILGVAATASIGLLSASIRILSKRSDPVAQIYQIAAMLFAGTFFSIDQLPAWLRPLSYAIPHTYVITGVRRLLMPDGGELAGPEVGTAIIALLVWCVVFYAIAITIYKRVMERGRELGVLAGY